MFWAETRRGRWFFDTGNNTAISDKFAYRSWDVSFKPRRHRGGGGWCNPPPSGFPRITRERIGRSSRNLAYLSFEQFNTFPENLKAVPTMTFDLWPDFQGRVKRSLRFVSFQRLKLANFVIYAGDMDMDRCWDVTFMVYTDIVTFPRSTEVIRGQWPLMTSYVFFSGLCAPRGNLVRWFWILHLFTIHMCRNEGHWGHKIHQTKWPFLREKKNIPKRSVGVQKAWHSIPKTVRNVLRPLASNLPTWVNSILPKSSCTIALVRNTYLAKVPRYFGTGRNST